MISKSRWRTTKRSTPAWLSLLIRWSWIAGHGSACLELRTIFCLGLRRAWNTHIQWYTNHVLMRSRSERAYYSARISRMPQARVNKRGVCVSADTASLSLVYLPRWMALRACGRLFPYSFRQIPALGRRLQAQSSMASYYYSTANTEYMQYGVHL